MSAETHVADRNDSSLVFGGAVLAGAFVAVVVGVFGRVHDPEDTKLKLFFSDTIHFKVWATTLVLALAIAQFFGGLWMFGKLPGGPAPSWVGPAHRISGTLAFLVSLPVAYHCLFSLGFNPEGTHGRQFVHSLLGCTFYGAFVTKVLVVRSRRMPGWAIPVIGGLLFTAGGAVDHERVLVLPQHRRRDMTDHLVRTTCTHDCPDACSALVTVDADGRAVEITADRSHPITGTASLREGRPISRAGLQPRPGAHATAPNRAEGERRVRSRSVGTRRSTRSRRAGRDISSDVGPTSILGYSYLGSMGLLDAFGTTQALFNRLGATRLERSICGPQWFALVGHHPLAVVGPGEPA